MILNDQVAASVPRFGMLTVFLLAGAVLPAWSIGGDYLQPNSSRQSTAVATAGESRANNGVSGRIFVGAWFRDAEAEDESSMPIIAVDPATGEWRKVAGGGQMPVVSADGKTLAFQRNDKIWMCDTSGEDRTVQVADVDGMPIWSPDGRYLIASQSRRELENDKEVFRYATWKISLDDATKTRLNIPATDRVTDWSPDGRWLVTVRRPNTGPMKLVLVRSDGTEARQLPIKNGPPDNARFSPDSRRIAYRCFKAGMMSIRVTNLNGKNDRLLFEAEGVLGLKSMTWSPNGKHLAVVAFDWKLGEGGRRYRLAELDHNFRLLILDANGDHKRELKIRVADNQKVFQLRGPHWQ